MTTANKVTILRILLVPFFVVEILYYMKDGHEEHRLLGLLAFAVAAILDGVDGYIARRYNQKSELGAILDPLADKLLLVSGIVLLSLGSQIQFKVIPLWFTATVISRDVLVIIGLVVILLTCDTVTVRPRMAGKIATVLQMVTVLWTILKWNDSWRDRLAFAAASFTGLSGLWYVWDGIRQLSASPRSSPKVDQ